MFLLVNTSDEVPVDLRATAGLLLKNNVRYGDFPDSSRDYVKQNVLKGLLDDKPLVRNIAGSVVTTVLKLGGISAWPNVLSELMNMVDSDNVLAQEGAMSALDKICEDSATELDQDYGGERPTNYMIPKFLQYTRSPSPKVRSHSINCMTQFIVLQSQVLMAHVDEFLNALFSLASDDFAATRKNIASAFLNLLEVRPDKLLPHLEGIINYCLHCIKDDDEQVAAEGCEFILALAESTVDESLVRPHLPKIIPVILSTMVYSEMDRFLLESMDDNNEDVEDRVEDIKPTAAKGKEARVAKTADGAKSDGNAATTTGGNEDDDDDEDEDEDDMELSEWNLRKCSAAALDVFATSYPDIVLETSLPYLRENIVSSEWYVREAAILAFGAVAEGCTINLAAQLPQLTPFLVERLRDAESPVRQITCWTLGRYSHWIVENSTGSHQQFFQPVLEGLLKCMLDRNKKVQEAASSAVTSFIEAAGDELAPYLEVMLQHFTMCLKKYKHNALITLYDTLQTLVERLPHSLAQQKYAELLLPPLLEKWTQLPDDDRDLWPLLECLASVTAAFGELFAPYAESVFERTVKILRDNLIQEQQYQIDPTGVEPPEKDFVITGLDLVDGLIQGLGGHASQLVARSDPPLVEMILMCLQDQVAEVRQSAFALLGDMAMYTYDQVHPYFGRLMKEAIPQIEYGDNANTLGHATTAVCNNAIWSVGEISLKAGREMEKYLPELLQRLASVLTTPAVPSVLENAAICIGRLGLSLANEIAPHYGVFMNFWIEHIKPVEETDEKDTALRGMCQVIGTNPGGLSGEGTLLSFVELCGLYMEPSPELADVIGKVLQGFKSLVPNWEEAVMSKLEPVLANSLRQRYYL